MANGAGRAWTPEEDNILLESRKRGESGRIIGLRLDRTAKAVGARYAVLRSCIGYISPDNDNIRTASDELRDRIIAMFERQATDNNMLISDLVRKTLGEEPSRKSADSRHIHKTSSIIRRSTSVMAMSKAA